MVRLPCARYKKRVLTQVLSYFYLLFLLGAGVESMTFGYGPGGVGDLADEVLVTQAAKDCMLPMGITSENVASTFSITRQVQDEFAAKSFQKAAAAQKAGKFKDEIVPIMVKVVDPKTGATQEKVVDQDDGIRGGVTAESLSKLKAAFIKDGTTHAGKQGLLAYNRTAT